MYWSRRRQTILANRFTYCFPLLLTRLAGSAATTTLNNFRGRKERENTNNCKRIAQCAALQELEKNES